MKMGRFLCALALGTALLAGCSSLRSTHDPSAVCRQGKATKTTSYYLPKAIVKVAGAPDAQNGFVVTVSQTLVPETERKAFYVRYGAGLMVSDYLRVQVSPTGLLESVSFMDTNPNWNVINQGTNTPVPLSFPGAGKPAAFSLQVDPFDARSVDAFQKALAGNGCRVRFHLPAPVQLSTLPRKDGAYEGVVFHPGLPLAVQVTCGGQTQQAVLPVPDRRVTLSFDLDRGLVDQRGSDIEFLDGMLTTVHVSNQSLIQVILGVPKTLIESVIPLPPAL